MMDTKISSKSDNCPVESPSPAPTKSDSKIGRLKVRTPAEINKEFEGTPNSEEFEGTHNPADSSDQLRAFSFADFLRPPDPSPPLPTVSQLKEPSSVPVVLTLSSAQVVKTKRKSKYPGFGQTILFEKIKTSTKSSSSREIQGKVGSNFNSSSQFKVNLAQYQVSPRCPKPGFNHPQGIIPPAAITKSFPASVTGSYPTPVLTRSNLNGSSVTSFPMPTSSAGSYPTPYPVTTSLPTTSSVSRLFLTPSKTIISYSIPASGSTSFGETEISSLSQRNQLKKHSVSDTDARDISASWRKLKPTEVITSASTSKSSTAGSSSSQIVKLVGENFSSGFISESTSCSFSQFKSVPNKPGVQRSNTKKKYRGFGESTSSEDSQVIEKTRNKRNSSSDKSAKKLQISSIYELDKIYSSLIEPYDHVQKRKAQKTNRGFGEVTKLIMSQTKKDKSNFGVHSHFEKTNLQQAKIQKSRARKGIYRSGENTAGSSTDSTPEDFSSESIGKLDENENNNAQRNFEVQNGNFNYDDMSTDTDTEDDGRDKLLDGVVMTISGYEDPLRGRILRKAVAMRVSYRPGWTNDCSHLVCGFIGTFKYLQAKGRGKIVLGTWIEDCYKSRKKINWMEYILSEETADTEPADKTSISSDGLRFLADMEVRVKENYMIKSLAGKTVFVSGMLSETVQVMIQDCDQLRFLPAELEHLLPERGDKAKYVVKGEEEIVIEVISVDEGKDIAVVRWDGHKGAVVKLSHLCRVYEDTIVAEN